MRADFVVDGAALYLGDCRDVLSRLPERSVDLVFTDPPFGHRNNSGNDLISKIETALGRGPAGPPRPMRNDGPEANELFRVLVRESARLLRRGGCCCCCCCCGGGGPDPQFARWSLWMDEVLAFKQMIVWDKGPMGLGWHYRRSYETILVGVKRGGRTKWHTRRHDVENIIRPGDGVRKIIPRSHQHPTQKPVELAQHFISLHSRKGETVLDPFMGSGTTGIACRRLGRRFIGIECDRRWFRVARRRIVHGRC